MYITIESAPLAQLRANIDRGIRETLKNMQDYECETGDITVKITIGLDHKSVPDPTSVNINNTRDAVVPTIKHKVSTVLSFKDEAKGEFTGDFEIIQDAAGNFTIEPIKKKQTSMFDEESASNYGHVRKNGFDVQVGGPSMDGFNDTKNLTEGQKGLPAPEDSSEDADDNEDHEGYPGEGGSEYDGEHDESDDSADDEGENEDDLDESGNDEGEESDDDDSPSDEDNDDSDDDDEDLPTAEGL
jgi:hypothetical protein